MISNEVHMRKLQLTFAFPTVNMGIVWSTNKLGDYETVPEMYSKHLTSLSSYTDCIEELFSDQIYNLGRIYVCFL